jgi:hypothetical protein
MANDVDAALTELRRMFPHHCINLTWSLGIAAGQQVTIHLVNPEANRTVWGDHRFSQPTLTSAMTKAREEGEVFKEGDKVKLVKVNEFLAPKKEGWCKVVDIK